MNDKASISVGQFTFHGIPAKHNEIDRDEKGNCKYMGYVISFGKWNIYHSGDTLWFDEMVDLLLPFKIDLALPPINGNDPARGVAGNLDTKEARTCQKNRRHLRNSLPLRYVPIQYGRPKYIYQRGAID